MTVTDGVPREVQEEVGVPVNNILSNLTPLPVAPALVNLIFNVLVFKVPILKLPDSTYDDDEGVAEVNVVVDHVEPLSKEYSTKAGLLFPEP